MTNHRLKQIIIFIFGVFALGAGEGILPSIAWGSVDVSTMNRLEDVIIDSSGDELVLRLEFKRNVTSYRGPSFYAKSVQIDFPNAYIEPSKRFFDTGASQITQVFAAQFTPQILRIRLLAGEDGTRLEDNLRVERKDNVLTLHVPKAGGDVLSQILARTAKEIRDHRAEQETGTEPEPATVPVSSTGPAEAMPVYRTSDLKNPPTGETPLAMLLRDAKPEGETAQMENPDPSKKGNKSKKEEIAGTGQGFDLVPSGMRMVAMLSLVLGLMFLLFWGFKKYVLKNTAFGGGEKMVQVLNTTFIGPKKHIALVEVAGEVMVLGIARDTMSFLTRITDEEQIERIKNNKSSQSIGGLKDWFRKDPAVPAKTEETAPAEARTSAAQGAFSRYLGQYESPAAVDKNDSVAEVTAKIRQNLGKMKTR